MISREFERRRRQLMKMVGREGIAILPAAPVRLRNGNVEHAYRQDSRFYYVSGFEEPEAVAVLVPGRAQAEYVLFVRDRDAQREVWDGSRAGPEGAIRTFGAGDAFPISDIDEILPGLMEARSRVYYTMGVNLEFDARVVGWVNTLRAQSRQGAQVPQEFVALDHVLDDMRLYKSRDELGKMRTAAEISVTAHRRAMRFTRPGKMEFEVVAEIAHEFMSRNATMAYQPIVGGGANACVLHYRDNNARLKDGDLLLIDAGCEYGSYASDVTRTFPVNGRYSPEQRAIYELVLAAQQAAIAKVRPGNDWSEPHDAAVRVITAGLVKLKLLKGRLPKLIKDGAYRQYFMHRTGHWIGLDVHDVGDYKVGDEWRVLEPGMTLTVEPGIYIRPSNRVPKRFWNIGVRIEDDVAVTRAGADVLSGSLESDPDAIEQLMAAA